MFQKEGLFCLDKLIEMQFCSRTRDGLEDTFKAILFGSTPKDQNLVRFKEVVLVLIKRSHRLIQFRQLAVIEAEKEQGEDFKNKPR